MAHLTGGTFKYTRRIKPGDPNEYNAPFREATAEISWGGADEHEDHMLLVELINEVRKTAVDQVNKMLGKAEAPAAADSYGTSPASPAMPAVAEQRAENEKKRDEIKSAEVVETPSAEVVQMPRRPGRPRKPAGVTAGSEPVNVPSTTTPPIEIVTEISTKDFCDAITRKNAERLARPEGHERGRDPQNIRDLVAQYVDYPKTSRDIPAEKRAAFLADLEAL
ncbi:MAG: hypothetical protein EPO08_00120 [Rhodospirillaceae bacterium]|nr:MAG: hypothetical protein EPO08_00120 [Rhodospirillaceae bacterium]